MAFQFNTQSTTYSRWVKIGVFFMSSTPSHDDHAGTARLIIFEGSFRAIDVAILACLEGSM